MIFGRPCLRQVFRRDQFRFEFFRLGDFNRHQFLFQNRLGKVGLAAASQHMDHGETHRGTQEENGQAREQHDGPI